jgi:hypothetical protein
MHFLSESRMMKTDHFLAALILVLALSVACQSSGGENLPPIPTLPFSPFDLHRTLYGFFPSPPEISLESVQATYRAMGNHADVVLLQQNIPWWDFRQSAQAASQAVTDIHNQYFLARQNGMEILFVVDPLNGLNRRDFSGLPWGWKSSFGNPDVRHAYANFTMRILREFHPRYLGLASEINTYMDAHPEDSENFISLYRSVYDQVKLESPDTQVFVTFQWEDLNNLIPGESGSHPAYDTNWNLLEAFEPRLDVWAISSYPFIVFPGGDNIPGNYFTPLLARTTKPLAVAEGGFISGSAGARTGRPEDQVAYLQAIHKQLGGERLAFWIYLLFNDLNIESYRKSMQAQGIGSNDITTLGMFQSVGLRQSDGTPKPGLAVWDGFRGHP